jgi:hypothetical protein
LASDEGPDPETADAYLETTIPPSPPSPWVSEIESELAASRASPPPLDPTAVDSILADIAADSRIALSKRADSTLP